MTEQGNEDLEGTYSNSHFEGPMKLIGESLEEDIFQNEEITNPAVLQQNVRRQI